ncbi:MAG: DJ-1/PfpI family protein [Terricaulis sp.]
MIDFNRRAALLAAMLTPIAASACSRGQSQASSGVGETPEGPVVHDMSDMPASWTQDNQIAMLCYPRMTILDLIGPQYMFSSLMGATVHLVAKTRDPITSDTGVTIVPTATFDEVPANLAVLFAPGGTDGTLAAMRDDETRAFVADRGSRATYVTSVCTGSLILGAAGLLHGYQATSHWAAREALTEFGATPVDARVVKDRNRITGGGVTAGLDFGLQMLAEMRDRTYAEGVQLMCEYDPHPPFNAGSVHTAPIHVRAMIQAMVAPFPGQVRDVAREIGMSAG